MWGGPTERGVGATRAVALATQQAIQRSGCRVLGGAARRRMLTCWQGLAGSGGHGYKRALACLLGSNLGRRISGWEDGRN